MARRRKRYWRENLGASAIEYALIACLLAVIALSILSRMGALTGGRFSALAGAIA